MGVPKFIRALYGLLGQDKIMTKKLPEINIFLLDFPQMLHSNAQYVYAYGKNVSEEQIEKVKSTPTSILFDEYYKSIISDIITTVNKVNPKILGIFFDGVPVGAKIQQQRQRRFWSAQESNVNTQFDSNNITVGTPFIKNLNNLLEEWIEKVRETLPETVIYSSPYTVGEGEHKMMDFLRQQDVNSSIVIYGLDTDLFLLALLLPNNKIFLWRKQENPDIDPYLDVNMVKQLLIKKLNWNNELNEDKKRQLIRDFVTVTFLLGNDFIPRNFTLENFNYILIEMVALYKEFQSTEYRPLTNNDCIIWKNMLQYIKLLAKREPEFLLLNAKFKYTVTGKAYDQSISNNSINYGLYKQLYYDYKYAMETKYGNIKLDKEDYPKELVKDYLKAINFVYDYYTKGGKVVSKNFYYRFHYAPLLSDLINIGVKLITEIVEAKEWISNEDDKYLTPLRLLVAVLPLSSNELYPQAIRNQVDKLIKYDNKWKDLFPNSKIIKDGDGTIDPTHGPILVPFFDPQLAYTIKTPKPDINIQDSWTISKIVKESKSKFIEAEEEYLF